MSVLSRFVEEMRERYTNSNHERVIIHLSDSVRALPFLGSVNSDGQSYSTVVSAV